ncbi:MAG: hypothetical protein E6K70_09540 [Planctomycetota bacterium]|nr:MAG: hypothetical protein E6K70_09540 [Planctomycetota bacterium]
MALRFLTVCLFVLAPAVPVLAGSENHPAAGIAGWSTSGNSGDALADLLRNYLIQHLPQSYEKTYGWGHTKSVATGIKWTGKGLDSQAHIAHGERNDGVWRKVRMTALDPAHTLTLDIRNIQQPETGRTTFEVLLAFDARVEYERQRWKAGVRLSSTSARARLHVKVALACEVSYEVDWQKKLLPEMVFRLHVVRASLSYDGFVMEHVAGVGGDAAKVIGDAVLDAIRQWHPSLERKLLARANAAIEKAGNNKELRIGLSKLVKVKSAPANAGAKKN